MYFVKYFIFDLYKKLINNEIISVKITKIRNSSQFNDLICSIYNYLYNKSYCILLIINLIISFHLLIQNNKNSTCIKELLKINSIQNKEKKNINKNIMNLNNSQSDIDLDMIGIKYPEIYFDKFKYDSNNGNIISSFCNFLTQLEIKLIYLEKEINVTKLNAFYTARTLYLQKKHIHYDDSKIVKFHEIMSWLVIHKSTQLKGIASDKYLSCRYVQLKIGKNLCSHRIGVYNNVEEINFENLIKMKNVVLKVTNGCHDNVYITQNHTMNDIDKIKKDISYHFNRDYSFIVPEFFHTFSKKRIIIEKIFKPKIDLYEFKFLIFNHKIKMCMLCYFRNEKLLIDYLDDNFNPQKKEETFNLSMNIFKKEHLDELKSIAIKLSEDFPNFIRVDLYLFHNKIYLSELTFDSQSGVPVFEDLKFFNDEIKKWKRIDY